MLNDHFKYLLGKPLTLKPGAGKLVSFTPGGIPNLDVNLAARILGVNEMVELLDKDWATVNKTFAHKAKDQTNLLNRVAK